ncbi:hypothetical protein NQ152_12625 [Microbacterium sp. zg.B48]|uniref:hypothetical protein n=1 Tax=Microbacterium sp. zg.B48 TaxID=2969408 RepID=UPI00214AEFBA|nr:hypothetical protein [Microbacterium sp. zg.B48]MCR2764348.1 hypothetical protein [Microbacterium sp. zg.B48]
MSATNARHRAIGNAYTHRRNVFTAFHDAVDTVYSDADVPRARFNLIDPAPGLIFEVIDAPSADALPALESWLLEEHLPARIRAGGGISSAGVFRVNPPRIWGHSAARYAELEHIGQHGTQLTILWFLADPPAQAWAGGFADAAATARASGRGEVALVAPFIPLKMATDSYMDRLRDPLPEAPHRALPSIPDPS